MPTSGKAAARTALPQPPRTSQNVPINSAESFENTAHSFGENVELSSDESGTNEGRGDHGGPPRP